MEDRLTQRLERDRRFADVVEQLQQTVVDFNLDVDDLRDAMTVLLRSAKLRAPVRAYATFEDRIRTIVREIGRAVPPPKCPKCGADMRLRTNRRDHSKFWGCPHYPSCRGVRASSLDQARRNAAGVPRE